MAAAAVALAVLLGAAAASNSTGRATWLARGAIKDSQPHSPDGRIIGGEEAKQGQFPFIVSIRLQRMSHFCGGSIVSKAHILTAAHCLDDKQGMYKRLTITAGSLTWEPGKLGARSVTRDVVDAIPHEKWVRGAYKKWYDVAILVLLIPFDSWTDDIQPITLNTVDPLPLQTECSVIGWGKTADSEDCKASPKLMWTTVQIKDEDTCRAGYGQQMGPGSLCVGHDLGGRDACQGDSGGPLVCNGLLAGIVSFGHGCGVPGFPGVYTAVAGHLEWIHEHTGGALQSTRPVLAQTLLTLVLAEALSF